MIKEKFIIINSESKILVFFRENKRISNIFLPVTLIKDGLIEYNGGELFTKDDSRDEFELLEEIEVYLKRCNTVNNHLKINNIKEIKKYYAKYEDLSKEKIKQILDFCYELDLLPEFLSINEIFEIINNQDLQIHYDNELPKILTKLKNEYNIR